MCVCVKQRQCEVFEVSEVSEVSEVREMSEVSEVREMSELSEVFEVFEVCEWSGNASSRNENKSSNSLSRASHWFSTAL